MMNWKRSCRAAGLIAVMTFSLVGCNSEATYTPQEIIDQALQESKEPLTYYGEYTLDMGELGGKAQVKEWVKDSNRRIEMTGDNGEHVITVKNDAKVISYDVTEKTAYTMDYSQPELGSLQSPKDQVQLIFNMVKDTHDIKIAGEEKVAGRDTYKIVAKTKNTESLFSDMEAWIDKKTWLTLKMESNNAGNQMITEYSKINFDEKIDDQQFILDLPKDVMIQEINGQDTSESISLGDVKQQLEKFLLVPEVNGLTLDNISMVKGIEDRPEYSFDYSLDGELAFFVTIFKADASVADIGPILNEKEIDIRGQKGAVMDGENFRSLAWQENGYQYSMVGQNPELTVEDLVSFAQQMTVVQ
ncbi:outer membrane lipoprotein-sorting protein [Lysinibacillus sp. ACHW1.5]|uniref:LolA family protein n=1 Tax=Lysinibacillus sp. ACHW1.5 TaxID=2913506 RepID=UPI001EDA3AD9|nr:outer membrane lipoprotein-sorting protein [Lysinibacillus sp. ACHW1.5]UKJ47070.1 outer membrane lipoprotein-sorting protein [Lysinibacillus sp. ACHW1.5]